MGAKASHHKGSRPLQPLPWVQPPLTPLPEVHELFGDEAEAQWTAAWLNQYLDDDERAFAGTMPAPLM